MMTRLYYTHISDYGEIRYTAGDRIANSFFLFVELPARRNGKEMVIVTCEYLCKNGLQWKECWNSFDGEESE